jgi:hypothetical protein
VPGRTRSNPTTFVDPRLRGLLRPPCHASLLLAPFGLPSPRQNRMSPTHARTHVRMSQPSQTNVRTVRGVTKIRNCLKIFLKDTSWKVYRFYRRRGQDGRYNAKRLHDTNTTPRRKQYNPHQPSDMTRLVSTPAKNSKEGIHRTSRPCHNQS